MKFSIKDFFSKYEQLRRKWRIWSHLVKKPLMENFIFCAVYVCSSYTLCPGGSSFYQSKAEKCGNIIYSRNLTNLSDLSERYSEMVINWLLHFANISESFPWHKNCMRHGTLEIKIKFCLEHFLVDIVQKWSFPLRISSVNVTKSAVYCWFGHIYWRNAL